MGKQYVLELRAVDCRTGDTMASAESTADGKEQVLKALSQAAGKMREKLGESIATAEKFDTPLDQVTTTSLDALQAFSRGRVSVMGKGDFTAAIPQLEKAGSILILPSPTRPSRPVTTTSESPPKPRIMPRKRTNSETMSANESVWPSSLTTICLLPAIWRRLVRPWSCGQKPIRVI